MTISLDGSRDAPLMLRPELLLAGYTDKAIARLLKWGQWVRVRNGAYTEGAAWTALDEAGRHLLRARAVVAQARTPVIVSHTSGLPFFGAPLWGLDLSLVHVTRRDGRTGRKEAGVDQHRGRLIEGDVVRRVGVDVMSPTRLALEVTMVAGVEPSLVVVNDLLHRKLTTQFSLAARYDAMGLWPWTLNTDIVLRLADPRIESVGESRTYLLCFRQRLPMPEPQYEITDANGRVVACVDFAWPELGVFLEFDGKVKYEKFLKPGERASAVVVREKKREDLIRRLTGWRCIRLTWADLEHPEQTAAMIRSVLYPNVSAE
jgi:hypothetical protein